MNIPIFRSKKTKSVLGQSILQSRKGTPFMGSKSNASIERFSMAIRLPMQPVQVTKVPNERKKEKNEKQKQ